jgi:hypothetical protein
MKRYKIMAGCVLPGVLLTCGGLTWICVQGSSGNNVAYVVVVSLGIVLMIIGTVTCCVMDSIQQPAKKKLKRDSQLKVPLTRGPLKEYHDVLVSFPQIGECKKLHANFTLFRFFHKFLQI